MEEGVELERSAKTSAEACVERIPALWNDFGMMASRCKYQTSDFDRVSKSESRWNKDALVVGGWLCR